MTNHQYTILLLTDPAVGPEHGLRAGQLVEATERLAYRRRRERGDHGTSLAATFRWSVKSSLDGRTLHIHDREARAITLPRGALT